ncbi:hypothetical protein PGT21_031051 [Puccinia graminis f. sp. tritici]|uniref:Uncharacterized protein n=1 Tax=Puccinia graminis f. sp. tritici TaxID=56615 RepID=A0A5B0PF04_PUCGR|nr:hypothetical protein PGT21_031051 [Puccinia graminis f. sp. tritici]KAA1120654.1 hypothetical protein PGTUg99_017839 [Puccinia graminis f. sp. tritici]
MGFCETLERFSYQLIYAILWSSKAALTIREFDLNLPVPESLDGHEAASSTLQLFSGKRKYEQIQPQPLSVSPTSGQDFLSYAQLSKLSSEYINPSFTTTQRKCSRAQTSIAGNNSMVGSGISRETIGIVHHETVQMPECGTNVSQPLGRLDIDVPQIKLPVMPPIDQENAKQSDYKYLFSQGRVVEKILRNFIDRFADKVSSEDFKCVGRPLYDKHPNLPIARVARPCGKMGRTVKVLAGESDARRSPKQLISLYSLLAVVLYKLHGESLNQCNISTFDHKIQQERLFGWLDRKLFDPIDQGLPMFGVVYPPYSAWNSNDPSVYIDPLRVKLIQYFSRDICHTNAYLTAVYLLKTYQDQHPSEYLTLVQSSMNIPVQYSIEMNPSFQEKVKNLSNLAKCSIKYCNFLNSEQKFGHFEKQLKMFKNQFDGSESSPASLRSYHPQLPISIFFCDQKSDHQFIRILDAQDKIPIIRRDLAKILRKLLASVDCLNMTSKKIENWSPGYLKIKSDLSSWILNLIINPEVGIPLIGSFKHDKDFAIWYDEESIIFGEIQLKLLKFFSEKVTNEALARISVFLLAIYQIQSNDQFFV